MVAVVMPDGCCCNCAGLIMIFFNCTVAGGIWGVGSGS